MPEYLAPGVYVEETSFRARSIQGVGTSTTGFVGLARKGPADGTPQLVTSFDEYVRLHGGLADLALAAPARADQVNYLAYAVYSFFREGGTRLYIARAWQAADGGDGRAGAALIGTAADARHLVIRARHPGTGGAGRAVLSEKVQPATATALDRAPVGTLARSRGTPALPASLDATMPPAALTDGAQLQLVVNGGAPATVTIGAGPAEVTGQDPLPDTIDVPAGAAIRVTVNGTAQILGLTQGDARPRGDLINELTAGLAQAVPSLTGEQRLVLTSRTRGSQVSLEVEPVGILGITARLRAEGSGVGRLDAITPADLNTLFATAGAGGADLGLRASLVPGTGNLRLSTTEMGGGASLQITGQDAVRQALGFPDGLGTAQGTAGTPRRVFVREAAGAGGWHAFTAAGERFTRAAAGVDRPDLVEDDWIVSLNAEFTDTDGISVSYEDLGFSGLHPRYLGQLWPMVPRTPSEALANPLMLDLAGEVNPAELHAALFAGGIADDEDVLRRGIAVTGGSDGAVPPLTVWEDALGRLGDVDDIAIVAAPGSSAHESTDRPLRSLLASHAEDSRFRIAVLDPPRDQDLASIRVTRAQTDNSYAALYWPWIVLRNPAARPGDESIPKELALPPSGAVCGLYARNDALRGVWKTPANEIMRIAERFEREVNQPQQEVLNPIGINCFRFLSGRGNRLYGGRLATSDREVVYVSDRRFLNYLKRSIFVSMQWAVFEPNGPALWANVRDAVSSFLFTEWRNGALLGANPDQAFFVRCDRSTMTQADLDNGRMVCEIGIAIIKPAEFVIFRIGQKTADSRS
jgi:phage tail sheath protein FI